jgi:N,N'-diacetylchitobiose phosphorylase
VVKNDPAYTEHDPMVGAITCFPPGLKENGGIFCHAACWSVVVEGMLGRGDHAMKLYRSFLPAAKNDTADVYTMEPYVYSQFITGKAHPHHFGRARNSWLTGTASWAFVAISQYILGVRADYDGLTVDPSIPAAWDGFEVTRVFRGATYNIKVTNPRHVCHGVRKMTANGKVVTGSTLPVAAAGQTVVVEIELG